MLPVHSVKGLTELSVHPNTYEPLPWFMIKVKLNITMQYIDSLILVVNDENK